MRQGRNAYYGGTKVLMGVMRLTPNPSPRERGMIRLAPFPLGGKQLK